MPFAGAWCKVWIYFGFVFAWTKGARPRFDTSADMGLVLVPADAEVDSVIFRLRATDQDADFPLVFEITATITPVVKIDNLPCTLYNKVCQANVILTKRLVAGRLHDFAVRVRDTKGDSNSMQATISVTNATTPRDKIFPHIPTLVMVPEDTKPGKELDYLLVRANSWSGKPVYIELWQPKELFTIRQRQTPTQTRGIITLIGELDFETQSVYTLTMYATDPYTEPGKDTRNIAGLNVAVVVTDVQDVPPIFTLAPPLTRINNSVQPGDIVLRVHAEDGDKGVPREIVYGLVSEGNPFTPFFNVSETTGEITLARPLEELTQITHVGAPVVLTVVAEEIRRSREEPPAQATVVDVGFLLGEPGNSPPYFENDNYVAKIDENLEPSTVINFGEQYSARVKDEDIGKAGVFALKLENNNGTFEINPTVAERTADFIIIVRDNTLIDYELYKTLSFKIVAQEVGPATNLSASVPVTIFLNDVNDNPPVFEEKSYEVTLSENVTAGSRVIQVHATDVDTGSYGEIRYTGITGEGNEAFAIDPDIGLITVAMGSSLDRETAARLLLSVEAQDENGNGNKGVVPLIVNLLDVNDNSPTFEKDVYEFTLNAELTNFTSPALIKAIDVDAEPPNNIVRYELIHGNYENKFYLNETSGELTLRSPITNIRRKKQSAYNKSAKKGREFTKNQDDTPKIEEDSSMSNRNKTDSMYTNKEITKRRKRANDDSLYTLTARAYDLGIPHLSSVTQIRIISGIAMEARIMMFVVSGEQANLTKTTETLATITGGRVTVLETRPYVQQNHTGSTSVLPAGGKKSIIVARVEQTEPGTPLVDVEKIRETLAANGVGIIGGGETVATTNVSETKAPVSGTPRTNEGQTTIINNTITSVQSEEVTVYKAENKLLFWLLIILGLLMLLAIAALIICCICPGCPFYMAPRKRRVHSSETLVVRSDGRPKRHLHRQPANADVSWNGRKQAWSADPTRRNWQFNKRNVKNCSLPGDVAYISRQPNDVQINAEARRPRGTSYDPSRRSRMDEQERMYMEEVEGQKTRGYDPTELDSLQRHEMERGSDMQRQGYRQRFIEPDMNEEPTVREQHFYREGNAEVLRLVTRGQVEDTTTGHHHHHHPTTLIVDGKDIILQRFIEDQKSRHELSMQDIEAARVMESHQRSKEACQQQPPEIILIPERLDLGPRQHMEEIGPNVQRLVIDHGDYESQKMEKEFQIKEAMRQERQLDGVTIGVSDRPAVVAKDQIELNKMQYSLGDLELSKQKALLARLLLRREHRQAEGGIADSASYLETQSLPGQVAIATQTDRTTATQTERQVRSRSDNDESDEDSRHRKKLKSRKRHGDGDWKRTRTLWMKSPIEEEGSPRFDKRLSILRKKVREVKEDRKISLEPEVLREISDSLDGNGSSYKGEEDESVQTYRKSTEQTSISYKVLNEKENGSSCSMEVRKSKPEKEFSEKICEDTSDCRKMNGTESTSSPEIKVKREKQGRERTDERSPKKEAKPKAQKKSEGVIKPSFRILEKEFTMLTKKLSKLGDKKFQESTGSDSTSQEKLESKDQKKEPDQKASRKLEASSSHRQTTESVASAPKVEQKGKQKKEAAIAKMKQKLKYQQTHVMSTGSSEYDDVLDKSKRQAGVRQETKQKQPAGVQSHGKVKRQPQVDRRETKKQMTEFREEEIERRKDGPSKEATKTESKFEKTGKTVTRAPKLASLSRRDNIAEETTTSTNSDQAESKKDPFAMPISVKKVSTDSSGRDSNGIRRQERQSIGSKVVQRFSDDFVEESKQESVEGNISVKGKQENGEKKKVAGEKKVSADGKVQLKQSGMENAKSLEIEEQTDAGRTVEDSKILRGVAEQLIKSCTVIDATESKEMKEIEDTGKNKKFEEGTGSSEAETITIEDAGELRKDRKLIDVKLDDESRVTGSETITEDKKEVTQGIEKKLESDTGKDKFLENGKIKMDEIGGVKKHEEDRVPKNVEDKIEKFSEDEKTADTTPKQLERKVIQEMVKILPKQEQIDTFQSDTKIDELKPEIKSTDDTEKVEDEKLRVIEAKEGEREVEKPGEFESNDKTGLTPEIQLSFEEKKAELSRDETDDKKQDVKDESMELLVAHDQTEKYVKPSQPTSEDSTIEEEKKDTVKVIADNLKDDIDLGAIRSPPKIEEVILKKDDSQIKKIDSPEKEKRIDSEEEKATIQIIVDAQKNEKETEKIIQEEAISLDKVEMPHPEKKTSIETKINTESIKTENVFLDKEETSHKEEEATTKVKIDEIPDKEEKITETITEDNKIDVKEDIFPGREKGSDGKEEVVIKEAALDRKISEEAIFLDKEEGELTTKEETVIVEAETSVEKGEGYHDEKEEIATEIRLTDDSKKKEDISPEALEIESHPSISEMDHSPKLEQDDIFKQEIVPTISDVTKDDINQGKNESSKPDLITEENTQEHDIKKAKTLEIQEADDQDVKKGGVLSEVFKAVHSIAEKLTKGSIGAGTETEATEPSSQSEDKIIKKEVSSLHPDKKDENQIEISKTPDSEMESLKSVEEKESSVEDREKEAEEKKPISKNEKVIISLKEAIEKDLKVDVESKEHGSPEAIEKEGKAGESGFEDQEITVEAKETIEKDSKDSTAVESEKESVDFTDIEAKEEKSIIFDDKNVAIGSKEIIEKELKIDKVSDSEMKETSIEDTKIKTEDEKHISEDDTITKPQKMPETDLKIDIVTEPEKEETSVKDTEEETKEKESTVIEDEEILSVSREMSEKNLETDITIKSKAEVNTRDRKEEVNKEELATPIEEEIEVASKETIEKGSEVEKQEQSAVVPKIPEGDIKIPITQISDEKKNFGESREEKLPSSEEQRDEFHAKAEKFAEKVLEESVKLADSPDTKATEGKLAETDKKEEFHDSTDETSISFCGTDFTGPEAPADSLKIPEPSEGFEPRTEQVESRETEQPAEEQTPTTVGDEIQPFLEEQKIVIEEKNDEAPALKDNIVEKEGKEEAFGEDYPDISLPLFTNVIRTVDDSEDSDSSSDTSRKTTLTTRPYQTPRHRTRQSPERDNGRTMESTEARSGEEEEETLMMVEDKEPRSSKDETLEDTKDAGKQKEESTEDISNETVGGEGTEPKEEDKTPSMSKGVEGENLMLEGREEEKLVSISDKESSKPDSSLIPKRTEAESLKASEKSTKEPARRRISSQRKKKSTSEESSEEKAAHSHGHGRQRPRKKLMDDRSMQKDSDQPRQSRKTVEGPRRRQSTSKVKPEKEKKASGSGEKQAVPPKTGEIDTSKAQPKYMAWYKKNREEMEKRRAEMRATDDEEQLPRWLRRSIKSQKSEKDDKKKSESKTGDTTPRTRRKVKPLVNVESEQLKAIVRQGRKLRKAEGGKNEDPPVQIFASTPPAQPQADPKHHLLQHSEYKYEKVPPPFYLHPPPAPHPSPQMSPERFDVQPTIEHPRVEEDFDSGIAISLQGGNRLRHQQLLEKKSVFDIAYSEAAPPQLRADSTTPPS